MRNWQHRHGLVLGVIIGLGFGFINLIHSWLYPLADDTVGALLRFYGPMFVLWALASFYAARRTGRLLFGITTGVMIAFATFCVFDLLIFVRINLFFDELTGRADWQNMMLRFRASGVDSLRLFVNLDYLQAVPLKLAVSCAVGGIMGSVGGLLGHFQHR